MAKKNLTSGLPWPADLSNIVRNTGSSESLYTNAEQAETDNVEDSNNSWVTESCWSDEPSPASTLTNLNAH